MRKTPYLLLLTCLTLLPLEQARAFFCFRFAMGNHGSAHSGPPRYPAAPGAFPAAPHPSWYLRNSPPPAFYPPPYISEPAAPAEPPPAIPTPQPGM